ncbi:hypothetical protein D3C73_910730 [compost metagenome]
MGLCSVQTQVMTVYWLSSLMLPTAICLLILCYSVVSVVLLGLLGSIKVVDCIISGVLRPNSLLYTLSKTPTQDRISGPNINPNIPKRFNPNNTPKTVIKGWTSPSFFKIVKRRILSILPIIMIP